MTEQALQDKILQHTLQILRLAAGEENRVDEVLAQLETELKALLNSADLTAMQRREVEALIREADEAINAGFQRAGAQADTHALAVIVAEKTQAIMEDVIPAAARIPSDAVLMQLGKDVLVDGAPSSAWWAKQAEDTAFRFAAQVRQGIVNGETQERIVQRIVGKRGEPGIMETARRNARTLVHSSVLTAANRARLETFRRNSRLIKGVRWLSTLDSHTCKQCAALDGQAWNLDGEKLKGTKVEFMLPPAHFSCFPGDTLVTSSRAITGASKRWFDGEVVVIKTASGHKLTSTPNHPILTDCGWIAAGMLNVGSNVICDGGSEWKTSIDRDGDDVPTSIHHVAEAFLASRKMLAMPVEVSAEDFHGDGVGSDIAVIWSDSLLGGDRDALCRKHFRQRLLIGGSAAGLISLAATSRLAQSIERHGRTSSSGIGAADHYSPLGGGSVFHADSLLGNPVSQRNARPAQDGESNLSGYSELKANAGSTNTTLVKGDNVRFTDFGISQGNPDCVTGNSDTIKPRIAQNPVYRVPADAECFGDGDSSPAHPVKVDNGIFRDITSDAPAHCNAATLQLIGNRCSSASELTSDFFSGPPAVVLLDQIIDINIIPFSGHVYNLETTGGWYVAQGIVVHNCRCVASPIPKTFKDIGLDIPEPDEGERASSMGPVHGSTTFNEFLKRQSTAFVERTLGKKRADLFQAGKLTVRDLVSGTGRELTLDELRLE